MASFTKNESSNPSTASTPSSPAAKEIAACQKRLLTSLALIQHSKTQPTETAANAKDYRAVLKVLLANANNLDIISTKFTVTIDACIQQLETSAWAAALCKSVENACEGLVSSGTVAAACSCGRHLRNDLLLSLENVVLALQKQVQLAEERLGDSANMTLRKQLAVLTGQVSSGCKKITLLPKSNKSCLKRKILTAYKQTTDIISEQEEMIVDSLESPRVDAEAAEEGAGGGGSKEVAADMDNDTFFDMYDFTLSLAEIDTSRACMHVAKECEGFTKALAKVVGKHISDTICTLHAVEAIDSFIDLMVTFSNELNELGVCLCPPQNQTNIQDVMQSLHGISGEMSSALDAMLVAAVDEKSQEQERLPLLRAVQEALESVRSSTGESVEGGRR